MENLKLVITSLSRDANVSCGSKVELKKEHLDNSGSSSENRDPEFLECNPYDLEVNNDSSSQVLTDFVTFTRLENKRKKDYNERCRFCSSTFTNPLDFLRHKRTHSNKIILPLQVIENYYDYPNRMYCPICKEKLKTRNSKSIFIKHLLTHTTVFRYTCRICKKNFKRKDHMISHQKSKAVANPKRILLSNWNVRNDSSSVSAILHPEDVTVPRRYPISNLQEPTKNAKVMRKACLSTNDCYCREVGMKPKILNRPKKCLVVEELENKIGRRNSLARSSFRSCLCGNEPVSIPPNLDKPRYVYEYKDNSDLHLTDQRIDYEEFRLDEDKNFSDELDAYKDSGYGFEDFEFEEQPEKSICTLLGTRKMGSDSGVDSCYGMTEKSFVSDDLKQFRDDHYFETHDTGELGRDIPEHTCIHQFQLDRDLLPVPLNADNYGRSRCNICTKPMEDEKPQRTKPFSSATSSKPNLKNFSKAYALGLVPRNIYVGGKKSKIELKVNAEDLRKLGYITGSYKTPHYINTYALRQQKMSL